MTFRDTMVHTPQVTKGSWTPTSKGPTCEPSHHDQEHVQHGKRYKHNKN